MQKLFGQNNEENMVKKLYQQGKRFKNWETNS